MVHVQRVRNVNYALPAGIEYLLQEGSRAPSRAGEVLVAPGPVVTVYERPTERVLFSAVRDANPFFHLAEALWMLAGRDDAKFLSEYVRDFGARFAEEDGVVHDAYGHRWRESFGYDQLSVIVDKLRRDHGDRQCVVAMWDATGYHLDEEADDWGMDDLRGDDSETPGVYADWRGRPCNTHLYLRADRGALDLTVLCRSNDAVWGAHGANAVHFSVLQEYLAARVGLPVGRLVQFSNNYHAYVDELGRIARRAGVPVGSLTPRLGDFLVDPYRGEVDRYKAGVVAPAPIVADPATFDAELTTLISHVELLRVGPGVEPAAEWGNPWLPRTAYVALAAHRAWRTGDPDRALDLARSIESTDWRAACSEWLERRIER